MTKQRYADVDGGGPSRRNKKAAGEEDAEFKGYVNLVLSEADKEAFGAWAKGNDPIPTLDGVVSDGVQISVKQDRKTVGGFIASGTMRRNDSPNAGLCVTARAKAPGMALWRLLFSFTLLYRTGHWEDTQPMADPDRW